MTTDERSLDRVLSEALRLRDAGAPYSALARLGAILNVIPRLNGQSRAQWEQTLRAQSMPEAAIVAGEVRRNSDRLRTTINVGDTWNADELVLILTIRVELELVGAYLRFMGRTVSFDLADVDEGIARIRGSPLHAALFRSVATSVGRNWGLPIVSSWIGPASV